MVADAIADGEGSPGAKALVATATLSAPTAPGLPGSITAIEDYLAARNQDPKPFTGTATTDQILEKVRRGRVTLNRITT